MKKVLFILCIILLLSIFSGCSSSDKPQSENEKTLITGVYSKTVIPLEKTFNKSSNMRLFDGTVYFCGSLISNDEPQTVLAKVNAEDFSIQYDNLMLESMPSMFAITENRYIYIT